MRLPASGRLSRCSITPNPLTADSTAAALPRLRVWETTIAPAPAAYSDVRSLLPSSQTITIFDTWKIPCSSYGCGDSLLLVLGRDDARDTGQVGAHPPRLVRRSALACGVLVIGNLTVMSSDAIIAPGVRSEVGRLRTVLLHRPGNELRRLTPRNNDALLFDGLPWVDRAQEEHDRFAETLRNRGVEVLYLSELLIETLADPAAHEQAVEDPVSDIRLGETLAIVPAALSH